MPTIRNTTAKPISVPLPQGKRLHLGPRMSGEVTPKALDHPPLSKLVEAGDLEVVGGGSREAGGGSDAGSKGPSSRPRRPPGGGIRHFGDR